MPALEDNLRNVLLRWEEAGRAVSFAIVNKDYEACRKANRDASAAFKILAELLDAGADLASFREEALAGVKVWQRNIKAMPSWMEDVQQELKSVQQRIAVKRKLSGAYALEANGGKRSGIRLKIKAR